MKYFVFKRDTKKFDDILSDLELKKIIKTKISWSTCLLIGIEEKDNLESYVTLKYGDDFYDALDGKSYAPIPFVDYIPKRY